MSLIAENTLFAHWVRRGHLLESIVFYINKIVQKFLKVTTSNGKNRYPSEIEYLIYDEYQFGENPIFEQYILLENSNTISIDCINLAGSECEVKENTIDWSKKWSDPEDEESLHRWNWAIYKLSSVSKRDKKELAAWALSQQEGWIDKFQREIVDNKTDGKLRWESYTVGERVANSVVFYHHAIGGWPSVKFSESIQDQTVFLINHLEYFGENTGNHVVNNARAIYLAGVAFDCEEWKFLAFAIIEREVPVVMTDDGFMREGSSHYQFLFTRWMLEVYYFASVANDKKMICFLYSYLKLLIKQCHFFLVCNKASDSWDIPLFGDISPDFHPKWLLDIPWSNLVGQSNQYKVTGGNSWSSLWVDKNINKTNNVLFTGVFKVSTISNYAESGWFRASFEDTIIFMRVDKKLIPKSVGHHHHDMYHFCLYCKGRPILVDSGRLNYKDKDPWSEFGVSASAHNSILIDGVGAIPKRSGLYPIEYTQANNRVDFLKKESSIMYTLSSSCFERIDSSLSVVRSITLSKNKCVINDIFSGTGEHLIESFFHWGSSVGISHVSDNVWDIDFGEYTGHFKIFGSDNLKSSLYDGGGSPYGWIVDKYGKKTPSSTLQFSCLSCFPVSIKYELTWSA